MKILVTSAGDKVPLIESIRRSFDDEFIEITCCDIDSTVTSRYFCSEFWDIDIGRQEDIEYIFGGCKSRDIDIVIPTRDAELIFWARHRDFFAKNGINVMVASEDAVDVCLDKYLFYKRLIELNLPAIPTFASIEEVDEELLTAEALWVVKNRFGAGSRNIYLKISTNELLNLCKDRANDIIIQPYIFGKEFSVDTYCAKNTSTTHCVARERVKIKNGESQVTKIVNNEFINNKSIELVNGLNLHFHSVMQWMQRNETGEYSILECNPRIGGASTLSIMSGLNSFKWFAMEARKMQIPQSVCLNNRQLTLIRIKKDLIACSE